MDSGQDEIPDNLEQPQDNLPSPSTQPEAGSEAGKAENSLVSQVNLSLHIAQGTRLRITVEALPGKGGKDDTASSQAVYVSSEAGSDPGPILITLPAYGLDGSAEAGVTAGAAPRSWGAASWLASRYERLRSRTSAWPYSLDITLFGLSLIIYLFVRLVGLSSYPVYFFSDEAVQPLLAADLLKENFHNADGEFLPTYFYNVDKYSLSTTVYMQLIPYILFGKSVFATRAMSVLVTLLAAAWVGLILRDVFKLPYWWSGTLLLSMAPAWFLHSRTAFETVVMASLYAGGLYYYLLYRYRSPRYLYLALVLFALAFYSYNPGQAVVLLTGLLLLISDGRYHWQNRATVLRGAGLAVLLALPYVRFHFEHPDAVEDHLYKLSSYWIQPIPIQQKLRQFGQEYLYGLSPGYWFVPNTRDLIRHTMKGYGHLHLASLPFALAGLGIALWNFRSSAHRAVLIALLAAPSGAALVQLGVTRALVLVIPATLLIALGVIGLLRWLEKKRVSRTAMSLGLFAFLSVVNFVMFYQALWQGPTWYTEYGLGGLQYGGAQMFGAVKEYLKENPEQQIVVSPAWANGTDVVARFFLGDPLPVRLGSIEDYMFKHLDRENEKVFVMTPAEFEKADASGKFTDIQVEKTVPYPNGKPGFYFVRLRYADNIDAILSAEEQERRELQTSEFTIDGQPVSAKYSMLDMGQIKDIWDGDLNSVARTLEANPFVIELTFPEARTLKGLSLKIGDTDVRVLARVYSSPGAKPVEFTGELDGSVQQPQVEFDFGESVSAKILRLEIQDLHQTEPAHVHIWEILFR